MYGEEYYYKEPSEIEELFNELKAKILNNVSYEIQSKIKRLEQENSELKHYKDEVDNIKREYENKTKELEEEKRTMKLKIKRERVEELFSEFDIVMYKIDTTGKLIPKCNKCDEDRNIWFKSPSGKDMSEKCTCYKCYSFYKPSELVLSEFRKQDSSLTKFYTKSDFIGQVTYNINRSTDKIVYNKDMNFDDFTNYELTHNLWFRDLEDCQKCCDYLNKKEKERNEYNDN